MKSPRRLALLALALLPAPSFAGGDGDPPETPTLDLTEADEARWMDLDAEIDSLSGLASVRRNWFQYGVLLRSVWAYSEDDIAGAGAALPDVDGFLFEDVDFFFETERDGFFLRVSADLDTGGGTLEDAYVRFAMPDDSQLQVGSFKPRTLRSAMTDPEQLVFRERTFLGSLFDSWDIGVQYTTGEEPARTTFSAVNGATGSETKHAWTVRYDFSAYEERMGDAEGARDAPNFLRMMVGGFFRVDDTIRGKADAWGADLAMTMGTWGLHAEYASLDNDLAGSAVLFNNELLSLGPDAQIWSVTYTQVLNKTWQFAGRWQEPDDTLDTKSWGVALNWFPTTGPVNFVGDATHFESDGPEGWIFSVGANFGYTRPAPKSGVGR